MDSSHTSAVMNLASGLKSGPVKDRDKAVEELVNLLNPHTRTVNLTFLGDKGYHQIFEGLFSLVLREKPVYYDGKKKENARKAAGTRLTKCASAIRLTAARGAPKLGRKTLLALIDHITQVLPGPDGGFAPPLMQDYLKALCEVLSRQPHAEYLARQGATSWEHCVDFLLDVTASILPTEQTASSFPVTRLSPIAATAASRSSLSSRVSPQSQRKGPQIDHESLRDAIEGLQHLVQASNAPVVRRGHFITDLVIRVLSIKALSLGSLQTMCFAVCNIIFARVQAEDIDYGLSLVKTLLPLMGYWWRAEKASQDELIKSLRNEISKTIYLTRAHINRISIHWDDDVRNGLESLADPLWQEYSKRSEPFRLKLHDLTFNMSSLPRGAMQLSLFGVRNHNVDGESHWAVVQNLAMIECILLRRTESSPWETADSVEQPRKKQRVREHLSRLRLKLTSRDVGVQRTALQLIPFLVDEHAMTGNDIDSLMEILTVLVADKDPVNASWALVATASCISSVHAKSVRTEQWKQVWHLAVRSVNMPATCRTACLLLNRMIDRELLPHGSTSEDANGIVTTADVNGPGLLCDTSLLLMLRLFHIRNARLPGASQATSNYMIKWVFLKWNPGESSFASSVSVLVQPLDVVNLLRVCCGAEPITWSDIPAGSGGAVGEARRTQMQMAPVNEYLLLLSQEINQDQESGSVHIARAAGQVASASDQTSFYASRRLVFELLSSKLDDLVELISTWVRKPGEGKSQISLDRFQGLLSACVIGGFLVPLFSELNTSSAPSAESRIINIVRDALLAAMRSIEPSSFSNVTLRVLRPCMPRLDTTAIQRLHSHHYTLLRIMAAAALVMNQRPPENVDSPVSDLMDLDDEFDSQSWKTTPTSPVSPIPRSNSQLEASPRAFYTETRRRLDLFRAVHDDADQIGLVPASWIQSLLSASDDDLLCCRGLLLEVSRSSLVVDSKTALDIIQRLGKIISASDYQCCEVALTTCIDVLDGLHRIWLLHDDTDLADSVGDLYNYFVKVCLPSNFFSANTQISMSRLLLTLLEASPSYGTDLELDSCRTSFLNMLGSAPMQVKFFIAERLANVFDLFVLTLHDDIFSDVLGTLPTNPDDASGIALRLFALSKLACRWPTLLRRCIYHIFETPAKIAESIDYAKWCLADISRMLKLKSAKDLFQLFSRQLLYTWTENDSFEEIPFAIFGFENLADLLRTAQAEAIALAVMRAQKSVSATLAGSLKMTESELIQENFATAASYSMAYGDAHRDSIEDKGEDHIKATIGLKAYMQSTHTNFVDIVASLFDLIDQEDNLDSVLRKHETLSYAANNLDVIRKLSHSDNKLPPNQQPMFRAKVIIHDLLKLCRVTNFDFQDLWRPALVLFLARRLFNSVHPALGSLHACSVLRKSRLLVCLAGPVALESYCVEMLLNSIRSFMIDPECADDALGVTQYLLSGGAKYLSQNPAFLAGYALSTLASLRVFLESSQSSTTQESQFNATMTKAQKFHQWFSKYLSDYSSPSFQNEAQAALFQSITQSAAQIRSSGNAQQGTAESKLLLDILSDGASGKRLLNASSRELALKLLGGDFSIPELMSEDIIETDEAAKAQASRVWKSCEAHNLSKNYLSWAGRVIGRSFAASGDIPDGFLKESHQALHGENSAGPDTSEMGLLYLLQDLTADQDSAIAGLAESALRTAVSRAIELEDEQVLVACQRSLSESLFQASRCGQFLFPAPSGTMPGRKCEVEQFAWDSPIHSSGWLTGLSTYLASAGSNSILLSVLPSILADVPGFAERAFPYIVHLVLVCQMDQQQERMKKQLSSAIKAWMQCDMMEAADNLKLLINSILYLRTQEYPRESSIADRLYWLDIDHATASRSASRCGMYKTALLFAELASSDVSRSSRRSSEYRDQDMNDTLLTIFENIDDPDTYYGLPEDASLSRVLARVEYENEGSKSLAFRGARFDSNIVLQRKEAAEADGQALVKALGTLGLSGLAHSVLHTQEVSDASNISMESTFSTARRLEKWNLPAPINCCHHAVLLYQAYQSLHNTADLSTVRTAIYDGLSGIMRSIANSSLNATAIRTRLTALAALTELDDLLNVAEPSEVRCVLDKFQARSEWMQSGTYGDVGQILSCRATSLSMLCQRANLWKETDVSLATLRKVQVESMILASGIYRHHQATQESLNVATALTEMIPLCEDLSLHVDAAIKMEVANSLWDHGEMVPSIRMLQAIDKNSSLSKQSIRVTRSELLAKIGQKVSLARLETPHDIQRTYLGPALKELRREDNREAGSVYHQFATFCDEQLQDPNGLEDLARLQRLRSAKNIEVQDLKTLVESTHETQLKTRIAHVLSKEKQWLELDEKELKRVEQTRSEFVQLSLENYLLSLTSSDEFDNDALRFTALWLERSAEEATNKAITKHLPLVPTRKFATLVNQLTSRLQSQEGTFQTLLSQLVYSICVDHPYHGMYQIWSGTKAKAQPKDDVAVQRVRATEKVAQRLAATKAVADIWLSIDKTSKYYHGLAVDRDPTKYKAGAKVALKDSSAGQHLVSCLARYSIPPPTLQMEVSATRDYSKIPKMIKLDPVMTIASGVSAPKIITAVGSNGVKYRQLVKGGHDDLRQDAIMEQVFAAVSSLLKLHRSAQQRNLGIRTYKVLPLTASSGLIEFVPDTIPLHEFLMPAHERYYPRDLKGSQCRKEIFNVQNRTAETRLGTYRRVTDRFHPVMRYFFMEHFVDPDEWFVRRLAYTRSTAVISMLGHVLGLGDRHGHNILLDTKTGEAVHIDLGVAFEAGRILPVPEMVPFRLTRDIVDGMGITKTEGVFRRCCEFTLDALREEQYSIMTILDVLRYDPLYTWSISPLRLAKLQKARDEGSGAGGGHEPDPSEAAATKKARKKANEPSEADRALEVVRKKLSKTLSVTATVNDLINVATDERNLSVLYSGWAAYA